MKKIILISSFLLGIGLLNHTAAQEKMKWKEMEAFHDVMAATFHPADEGKLDPLRTRSAEMMEKAKAWKRSLAPEGYDKKSVKKSLRQLARGTRKLNRMVKSKASDDELKAKISSLHDIFHQIMEGAEKKEN